jgi:CspA family cold shock protein
MKSFGFIARDEGEDVFVHASGIVEGPISDNDQVEFDVEKGDKGLKAVNVKKI